MADQHASSAAVATDSAVPSSEKPVALKNGEVSATTDGSGTGKAAKSKKKNKNKVHNDNSTKKEHGSADGTTDSAVFSTAAGANESAVMSGGSATSAGREFSI